ncbi:MAG: hypothetical protein O2923_03140 [Verrucomicrobia bacterium]|nr:hypothetical protein [Verrucomicrobiota bacterium]MDA1088549.1 hypothetical protein [Verrucomicrobiota bacterium]
MDTPRTLAARTVDRVIKVVLAGIVCLAALWLVGVMPTRLVTRYLQPRMEERLRTRERPDLSIPEPVLSIREDPGAWSSIPRYPAIERGGAKTVTLNGIPMSIAQFVVRAPSYEVINYYTQQMLARGWTDVTEERYRLAHEHGDETVRAAAYGTEAARRYEDVRDSRAIFRRGDESMHVTTTRAGHGKHSVQVLRSDTPSLTRLMSEIGEREHAGAAGRAPERFLDVSEQTPGGTGARTALYSGSGSVTDLTRRVVRDMSRQGWRIQSSRDVERSANGQHVFLTRNGALAFLLTTKDPRTGTPRAMVIQLNAG